MKRLRSLSQASLTRSLSWAPAPAPLQQQPRHRLWPTQQSICSRVILRQVAMSLPMGMRTKYGELIEALLKDQVSQ